MSENYWREFGMCCGRCWLILDKEQGTNFSNLIPMSALLSRNPFGHLWTSGDSYLLTTFGHMSSSQNLTSTCRISWCFQLWLHPSLWLFEAFWPGRQNGGRRLQALTQDEVDLDGALEALRNNNQQTTATVVVFLKIIKHRAFSNFANFASKRHGVACHGQDCMVDCCSSDPADRTTVVQNAQLELVTLARAARGCGTPQSEDGEIEMATKSLMKDIDLS